MIKTIKKIDHEEILNEYRKIESGIQWIDYGHKGKQAGLQHKKDEDVWSSAVGKNSGNETDVSILNPYFKNTIFESIINEYDLKRTRLMWSGPFSCYSMHNDDSPRIHIPLITNVNCYFLFRNDSPEHMPAGKVYWVNTRRRHTFINCSEEWRLHLVGLVKN